MARQERSWREEVVSAEEFHKLVQQLSNEERNNGKDFLHLVQYGARDMVFVTEGYHKQQSIALNIQLPAAHRAEFADLAAPPALYWHPAVNMLHPATHLSRELQGSHCSHQKLPPQRALDADISLPFGVTERCKLLTVQYIIKQLQQQQPEEELNPFMQHLQQQPQQRRQVLSMKVTVQMLSMQPRHSSNQQAEDQLQDKGYQLQEQEQQLASSSPAGSQQHLQQPVSFATTSNQGSHKYCPQQRCQHAYVCTLEYPLFQLESSDYIVAADVFERGLQQWSVIKHRDEFNMMWDDTPYLGYALKFRQRPQNDQFYASPWRSIEVDWRDQDVDRENDPEDWCYGNPWEMIRPECYQLAALPDSTALASSCRTSKGAAAAAAAYAPWTAAGVAAAAAAVEGAAAKKRKRQRRVKGEEYHSDEYETLTTFDDEFYYDDDPQDFMLDDDTQPRRKRQRQQQQQQRGRNGLSSRVGSASAVAFSKRGSDAAADGTDPTEPKHNFGREMLGVPEGVCLVCRKSDGQLVTGHSGRSSQNCSRLYHVGCLLLLNSMGIRSVMQTKQQLQQQPEAPDAAAVAAAQSDGLLQKLRQQQQSSLEGMSPAAAAAVDEAAEAAALHQQKQFDVCCPAHYCHGCGLNGKHEYMMWCCCCLVRTYHWRNCIPLGAEIVNIDDRAYVRCPACVAAGVLPPATAASPSAAVAAGTADAGAAAEEAAVAAADVQERPRGRRGRRGRQQQQQLELQNSNQENGLPGDIDQQQGNSPKQLVQEISGTAVDVHVGGTAAVAEADNIGGIARGEAAVAQGPPAAAAATAVVVQGEEARQLDVPRTVAEGVVPDLGSRRHSPATTTPIEQLQQLEQEYERILQLQQQYEQQQAAQLDSAVLRSDVTAGGEAKAAEPPSIPASSAVTSSDQPTRSANAGTPAAAAAPGSSRDATASSSSNNNSSSVLDGLMPAWVRFSLEDTERHQPSYKLVALPDCSSSDADPATAAALHHVAEASTRLPHQAAEMSETVAELSLASPQTHWLIGSAEKAESAKYKVTGSWTGCPVIQVPTPDEGVFGLCLVMDHCGLVEQPQQQQPPKGNGRADNAAGGSRRGRTAVAQELPAAAADSRKRPGVYLRCWKPVMQGSLQQQQRLMQLQQSGDERGGGAYQVLVNDKPFPEGLGRQGLLLQAGDVVTVQGRRFELGATPSS